MIWTMLEVAGDWALAALRYLWGWGLVALLGATVWASWRGQQKRDERRRQEALSAAWARAHGGDPEYGGGLSRRAS